MPRVPSNGMELEYDTFGDPAAPALLLIAGLGAQMISWQPDFCQGLADRGFHVIRYDNRDSGLSTFLEDRPLPDVQAILSGDTSTLAYGLADMADDAVGLLDALEVDAAHIVGTSMGGMIAQRIAIDHPARVLSLCSIMSTTGNRRVGRPSWRALRKMSGPPPTSREEAIEQGVRAYAVIVSPAYPIPREEMLTRAEATYDRCHRPDGYARQYAALASAPDRTAELRAVTAPTLVIHGMDDPLIHRSGGKATAAAIPGAELMMIPGMGHDLPEQLWPDYIDAVVRNADRAGDRSAGLSS